MKERIVRQAAVVALLLLPAACSIPFTSGGNRKSECDRIAAQAIQTESPARARDFAAQATDCYANLID